LLKLKEEINREAVHVAPYRLVEDHRRHAVKRGQVAVEDDALVADGMDGREVGIRHEVLRTQHRPDWTLAVTAPRRPEFNGLLESGPL
jgi:hypothetical protein